MIDAAAFVAGLGFLAARYGQSIDEAKLHAIHAEAISLGGDAAGFFFAIASRPRMLGLLWRPASILFARNAPTQLGRSLEATDDEIHTLRLDVAMRRADVNVVRAWFAARLR